MKKGYAKRQCGIIFAVSLFFLTLFAGYGEVYADTGPKPSVTVNIDGIEGEKYYVTLISKGKGSGPWSVDRGYEAHYGEENIWQKFAAYKDIDGYNFIGKFGECSGTNSFSWTYYPPDNFKVLIYMPSRDKFIVSSSNYERYAFHSYFNVNISLSEHGIEVKKSYPYLKEIIFLMLRMALCIFLELWVAIPFGFRTKRYVRFIVGINIITQLLLNVGLDFLYYQGGGGYWMYLVYPMLEIIIFTLEGIAYTIMLKLRPSEQRLHPWGYSFTSNLISLTVGFLLSTIVPVLF